MLQAFSSLSVVSAQCMYSKFRHHPHFLGYLCAKFRFFHGLHCWASPCRKITYSITHSPGLFDDMGTEAFASEQKVHKEPLWTFYSEAKASPHCTIQNGIRQSKRLQRAMSLKFMLLMTMMC